MHKYEGQHNNWEGAPVAALHVLPHKYGGQHNNMEGAPIAALLVLPNKYGGQHNNLQGAPVAALHVLPRALPICQSWDTVSSDLILRYLCDIYSMVPYRLLCGVLSQAL